MQWYKVLIVIVVWKACAIDPKWCTFVLIRLNYEQINTRYPHSFIKKKKKAGEVGENFKDFVLVLAIWNIRRHFCSHKHFDTTMHTVGSINTLGLKSAADLQYSWISLFLPIVLFHL